MKLKQASVKNFRCFADATVPIDDSTTVFVGPTSTGKTAFLQALQFVRFNSALTMIGRVIGNPGVRHSGPIHKGNEEERERIGRRAVLRE